MTLLSIVVWFFSIALPVALWLLALPRSKRRHGKLRVVLGTALLGAVAFLPALLIEGLIQRWAGLDKNTRALELATLIYTFVVAAPFEQGLKVAAVVPVTRTRYMAEPMDGVVYASAAALGFVTVHNAIYLWGKPLPNLDVLRACLAVPAHLFFAATWGYILGMEHKRGIGGRRFNAAWLGAVLFNGVYDHLVFARSALALIATIPMLLCVGFIALLALRDRAQKAGDKTTPSDRKSRFLLSIAPPTISAMREALRRSERPVMLSWIGLGALVTTGVMTATLVLAVVLGNRLGIDFSTVDQPETTASSTAPLLWIGAAALVAFPIAGYLIARASATRSVLEPAIAASLAILASLVMLGLAAPIAVVFAVAFAPIAFGLACAGAWMGMSR